MILSGSRTYLVLTRGHELQDNRHILFSNCVRKLFIQMEPMVDSKSQQSVLKKVGWPETFYARKETSVVYKYT